MDLRGLILFVLGAGALAWVWEQAIGSGVSVPGQTPDAGTSPSDYGYPTLPTGDSTMADALQTALGLIQRFESCSLHAYPDPPGQTRSYSIGWGHLIRPGDPYTPNSTISQAEADGLLQQDVMGAYNCVVGAVPAGLDSNQLAALISFTYNVGCGAFRSSTLLARINAGDLAGAVAEFPKWVHAGGVVNNDLVSRREQEQAIFQA